MKTRARLLLIGLPLVAGCLSVYDLPPEPGTPSAPPPGTARTVPRTPPSPTRPTPAARPPVAARRSPPPAQRAPPPPVARTYPPPVDPAKELQRGLAIQVALDRENCSPGCLDGKPGLRTRQAIAAWQIRHRRPSSGDLSADEERELLGGRPTTKSYTVTAGDHAGLAAVPATWLAKSRLISLDHETVLERLAERFHATQNTLRRLNPGAAWPDPPAGAVLTVPDPSPSSVRGAARIEISLGGKHLRAYDAQGRLAAHFPCSIAASVEKRPRGETRVANAAADPNYTFDPALFAEDPESRTINRRLIIPPGPNNPVGVAWIGLALPGYGIHGTPKPEDIGKTESHGCFRLANWNAEKLLRMVSIGTPVSVGE